MKVGLEFSPIMVLTLFLSFLGESFFIGMLIYSSFMYEDKQNLKRDSNQAWILSMTAEVGIVRWMFLYSYYVCKLFMRVFLIINRPKVGLNDYIRFSQ